MIRVAILILEQGAGGVERMLVNTANALTSKGIRVDLLVGSRDGPFLDACQPDVNLVTLGDDRPKAQRRLVDFLRLNEPPLLISAKLKDDRIAVQARDEAEVATQVYFRVGNPLVHRLNQRTGNPFRRWLRRRQLKRLYRRADGYIAVSAGIGNDLVEGLELPRSRVHVLPNPTITPDISAAATKPVSHPWFRETDGHPVVIAIGGFRRQKNFDLLIRAFADVRRRKAARLVILGDGRQRDDLAKLAKQLGIGADVDFPGWQPNPYAFLSRSQVFVSCSRWEGSPNVLVEAAALGVPLVAADCVSGPREILADGRFGLLVPVGNQSALSEAIICALEKPFPAEVTRQASFPYRAENSAQAYIEELPLDVNHSSDAISP